MSVSYSKWILNENNLKYQKNKNITLCVDAWREFKNYVETIDTIFCTDAGNLNQLDNTNSAVKLNYDDGLSAIPTIEQNSSFVTLGTNLNIDQISKVKTVPVSETFYMNKVTHKSGRPIGSKNKTKTYDHVNKLRDSNDFACSNQQVLVSSKQPKRKYQRRMINLLKNNK